MLYREFDESGGERSPYKGVYKNTYNKGDNGYYRAGESMLKQIANVITGCRILCSLLLLFFDAFSAGFYITYLLCGFSDMIDGSIARMTNAVSEFGTKFDTVADLIFVAVSMIKLLPIIYVPKWLLVWIVAIGVIKLFHIARGYFYNKKLISLHTRMNKVTGLLLFLFPLTLPYIEWGYSSTAVCFVATVALIQEGIYLRKRCKRQFVK